MRMRFWLLILPAGLLGGCPVPAHLERAPRPHYYEKDPVSQRGYYIYVPSTYTHDHPAPLIVSCHGTPPFDVSQYHIRAWRMLGEKHGCIVIAPDLVATDGLLGDGPLSGMFADERFILSIISNVGYRYNVDRANVMITGFSGGGYPTYWVGLRHPDVFSAVVARNCNFSQHNLDGWYPPEAKRTPVLVYWGSADPPTIIAQSNQAVRYLRANGFDVSSQAIKGLGHQRRPEVAMEFFLKHQRPPRPSLPAKPP